MRPIAPRERARAESIEKIEILLADGPMTAHELAQLVTVNRNTLYDHLTYMHEQLRTAHPQGMRNRSVVWSLGADPAKLSNDYRQHVAVGKRDPLVAALFGPATPQL